METQEQPKAKNIQQNDGRKVRKKQSRFEKVAHLFLAANNLRTVLRILYIVLLKWSDFKF